MQRIQLRTMMRLSGDWEADLDLRSSNGAWMQRWQAVPTLPHLEMLSSSLITNHRFMIMARPVEMCCCYTEIPMFANLLSSARRWDMGFWGHPIPGLLTPILNMVMRGIS